MVDRETLRAAARVAPLVAPDRLVLARDLRRLTQRELVEKAHGQFSAAALSQLEKGRSRPSAATLAAISEATEVPLGFFVARPDDAAADGFFRSLRSTSARERKRQLARARLLHDLVAAIEHHVRLPALDVPRHEPHLGGSDRERRAAAEAAADHVRSAWGLGLEPIGNVIRELERRGIIVVRSATLKHEVDAFSVNFPGRPVAVLGSDKGVTARSRFDAAHELGHLVLHTATEPGSPDIEKQAHEFAAAFLMPRAGIEGELPATADWRTFTELKVKWRVSIAALLMRAKTLEVMPPHRYTNAMKVMSGRGWRTDEPGDDLLGPLEVPVLLGLAIERLADAGVSLEELCTEAALPIGEVARLVDVTRDRRPAVEL